MSGNDFSRLCHECEEALLTHVRKCAVPVATLIEERHRPRFGGIGLENATRSALLSRSAELSEQALRAGGDGAMKTSRSRRSGLRMFVADIPMPKGLSLMSRNVSSIVKRRP